MEDDESEVMRKKKRRARPGERAWTSREEEFVSALMSAGCLAAIGEGDAVDRLFGGEGRNVLVDVGARIRGGCAAISGDKRVHAPRDFPINVLERDAHALSRSVGDQLAGHFRARLTAALFKLGNALLPDAKNRAELSLRQAELLSNGT